MLDQMREKSYRSGGRKVFPYDLLRVELRGVEESRRDLFAGQFFRQYLEQEVHGALRAAGCRFPENLRVEVDPRVGLPQRGEDWLVVEAGVAGVRRGAAASGTPDGARRRRQRRGAAAGQGAHQHRPHAWTSTATKGCSAATTWPSPKTPRSTARVSREHAHIRFDKLTGEYRLFNDRWYARGERQRRNAAPGSCATA